jgi:hypothetical protein
VLHDPRQGGGFHSVHAQDNAIHEFVNTVGAQEDQGLACLQFARQGGEQTVQGRTDAARPWQGQAKIGQGLGAVIPWSIMHHFLNCNMDAYGSMGVSQDTMRNYYCVIIDEKYRQPRFVPWRCYWMGNGNGKVVFAFFADFRSSFTYL